MKAITSNKKNYRISVNTDGDIFMDYYGSINFESYDINSWHEWGIIDANDNLWDAIAKHERAMKELLYQKMADAKHADKQGNSSEVYDLLQDISGLAALCVSFKYDLAWAMQEACPEYVQGRNEQVDECERMCRVLKRWEQDNPKAYHVIPTIALS